MIAETMKNEAARSLLERLDEKTKLVRFFRYNASAKHGVPIDPVREITIADPPQQTEPPAQTTTQTTVQPVVQQNGMSDVLKGVLATLAAGTVVAGSILGGMALSRTDDKPAVQQTTQDQPVYRESPFQYLEDQGEHLP